MYVIVGYNFRGGKKKKTVINDKGNNEMVRFLHCMAVLFNSATLPKRLRQVMLVKLRDTDIITEIYSLL